MEKGMATHSSILAQEFHGQRILVARGSCYDLHQNVFCLCFPLGVLQFLVLHLDLSSILSLFFCVWWQELFQFNSFTHSCPVSQHHLLKRLSFLHCIFLPPLSKIRCPWARGFISAAEACGELLQSEAVLCALLWELALSHVSLRRAKLYRFLQQCGQ